MAMLFARTCYAYLLCETTECHIVLLFRTRSRLERRAHCWFAAERAASLADAVPPCGIRADTVKVSGPTGNGCVTVAAVLQPAQQAAMRAALLCVSPLSAMSGAPASYCL